MFRAVNWFLSQNDSSSFCVLWKIYAHIFVAISPHMQVLPGKTLFFFDQLQEFEGTPLMAGQR